MITTIISTDLYKIKEFLEDVKRYHIPAEDSNSLILGMFGYLGDVFSTQIQNSIMLSSEWMNEIFPIRARLEKNLLTHAMMANITDLNATPSSMDILIGIREIDIHANLINDVLVLDKTTPIFLGDYEFHLEYDVKIYRQKTGNKDLYVAQYDLIGITNRLSTITNPYLLPPVKLKVNQEDFIFIRAKIRQVEIDHFYKKIISIDPIENRSFEFTFENQLADFTVTTTKADGSTLEMIPIHDESPIITDDKYCYFTYINANTIRVKFINSIYIPSINDSIHVEIVTTKGQEGNFTYKNDIIIEAKSDKISYNNLLLLCKPVTDAQFGENKKSIEDLKRIIPRELLSRGSITCIEDLNNFFNALNNRYNRLKFVKRVDNQFERTFSSFLLLKDNKENIIPTNTLDMKLYIDDFDTIGDRLVLKPGTPLEYNDMDGRVYKIDHNLLNSDNIQEKETNGFLYTSPFTIVINRSPLLTSYYLTIFNRRYDLVFKYINEASFIQFIATKISWKRDLVLDSNFYKMDIDITQNIDEEYGLITTENDIIIDSKIKVFGVVYNKNNEPLRYIEAIPMYYDNSSKTYKFKFKIETNDMITRNSLINITNMRSMGTEDYMTVFLDANNCKFNIFVLAKLDLEYGSRGNLDSIIPNLNGYTLCNSYEVDNGLDFFINFSEIISSKVKTDRDSSLDEFHYIVKHVPFVRYSYLKDSTKVKYFINYIIDKKIFIDSAVEILENSFNIDFKFFNTYGKSRINTIGHFDNILDKVNIKLGFRIKFTTNSSISTFTDLVKNEIKKYIEDVNDEKSFHISNIIMHLKNKFNFISYIEFLGINEYNPLYQSIMLNLDNKEIYIPEFININSVGVDYIPDIDIVVL